jgi:hypothetical protein
MGPGRQYAVTVAVGVVAVAAALWLHVPGVIAAALGVVYATAAYYTAEHPDLLRGREGPSLESGALAGVSTFGFVSLVQVEPGFGVVALAFGLTFFGFANGVAYGRQSARDPDE